MGNKSTTIQLNGKSIDLVVHDMASVKPYPKNAKDHPKIQIKSLSKSMNDFGFKQPIVIDAHNIIVAGHARYEAALQLGYKEILCVSAADLTDEQIKAYRILDNELAKQGATNIDLMLEEIASIPDFDFSEFNLDLPQVEVLNEGLCDEDECPEIADDPITKLGDIWLLGNHRLKCANSTCLEAVDRLMNGEKADMVFTDPPYNTGMTSESQKGSGGLWKGKSTGSARLSHMFNDSYTDEEWQTFMASFMSSYWMIMKDNSVAYICLDWRRNHELIPHIESSGFHRSNIIVWDKMVHGLGSDYKYTYELINVCKKGKPELDTHQGDREYSDVWHIQRAMGKNEEHATAKPIELMERAIRHASKPKDLVVDLFGGSGSTLIACEKTGRKCYMMELSENYCDVIVKRWMKFTGKNAILESNGKTFNELSKY